jgi:hypothetical protein
MSFAVRSQIILVSVLLVGGVLAATPAPAQEDELACCKIIRVDLGKDTAWLRNPRTAVVLQFRLGADGRELFKLGDLFNPETNELNGAPLPRRYSLSLPALDPSNAHIQRVRGQDVTVKMDEDGTVYRFRAVKAGNSSNSLEQGQGVLVDVEADWVFVLDEAHGKVGPSVRAFAIE